jgi:hypothetical protein
MQRRGSILRLASAACIALAAPLQGQDRPPHPELTSCASADSLLGPVRAEEPEAFLMGHYEPRLDSTFVSVFAGYLPGHVGVYANLRFAGRGPHQPPGLPLGFVFFGAEAIRYGSSADTLPVSLLLDDSLTLRPGNAVKSPVQTAGVRPSLTVNVILSRAVFLALVASRSARFKWPGREFSLGDGEIAALRALYRVCLCAPAGIPAGEGRSQRPPD